MPLKWQTLSIPFIGGVNQKADAKALPPPKLTKLENATFARDGALRKRAGSAALSTTAISSDFPATLGTCRALAAYDDELLYWTDNFLISYTQTGGAWRYRGFMESWIVSQSKPQKVAGEQTAADRATNLGLTIYAWEDSRGGVRYSAIDSNTGLIYTNDAGLDGSASRPRCVAVGTQIHVYYISGGNLKVAVWDPALYTASLSGALAYPVIGTVVAVGANFYDVAAIASSAAVVYCTSATNFNVKTVNQSGSVTATGSAVASGGNISAIGVACDDPNSDIGVAVTTDAGANSVVGTGWTFPGLAGGGLTTIDTGAATWNAITIVRRPTSNTVFDTFYEKNAGQTYNRIVYCGAFTVNPASGGGSGGGGAIVAFRHSALASRAWADGFYVYVHVVQDSTLQSTYFAIRTDARSTTGRTVCARILPGNAGGIPARNVLPQVESLGSRQYAWAALYKTRLDVTRTVTSFPAVYTERGIEAVIYDCNNAQSHRTARKGKAVYISGGLLWQYDGMAPIEQGFLLYPENIASVAAGAGGNLSAGSYSYRVYYEYTNAKGEREQSTIGAAVTQATGANDKVTLTIPTLAHTMKSSTNTSSFPRRDVSIAVYRTAVNPTDQTVFYRVSSPNPTVAGNNGYVANDCTVDTVTFVDVLADASLTTQEPDYRSAGELEHLAPPAPSVLVSIEDRIFAAGFEDGSQIWYSLYWKPDKGVVFNDTNTIEVPDEGGAITALAALNGALIIFKKGRIYAVAGDGNNNTGQNGTFQQPQLLPSDVGCSNQSSVVVTPLGLMFQSTKGLYLLNLAMQVEAIGAELGDTLGLQQIEAATLMPDRFEVRFLCSSGSTLVYNYYAKQWSVFTFTGADACLFHGTTYCYASGSTVYQESASLFQDAGVSYALALETGDIHAGTSLQTWGIFRSANVLGEFKSAHTLRCSFLYNAVGTFSETHDIVIASAASDGYEYSFSPAQPDRHFSIRVRLEDVSGAGESFVLNELAIEVGTFAAVAKVPASKSA